MSAAADDGFEPGSFGSYVLRSVVASDLTTTTYRATGAANGDVALRVVDDHAAVHSRAVKRFLHVNQRVAEVGHPHLLGVVDQGMHAGIGYAATAWRDGLLLADLLLESAPLDVADALRLGGQLAEALDTAHDRGIVHGTVGLQSVWIRRRSASRVPPSAALTAFGTSHLLGPVLHRVEDEPVAVDLLFVAPEQLRGEPAAPASDQYALACTLYTALTGTTPFRGETNNDLFGAHLFGEPSAVTQVRDDLDERWDAVFARALAKDPGDRFDNCRMLLLAAGACGGPRQLPADRPPPAVVTTGFSDDGEQTERVPRRALLVVLTTLLLVALLLFAAVAAGVFGSSQEAAEGGVTGPAVVILPGGA